MLIYSTDGGPLDPRDRSLFEGDIKLTTDQSRNLDLYGDPEFSSSRAANNDKAKLWTGAVVPYVLDCSIGKYYSFLKNCYTA